METTPHHDEAVAPELAELGLTEKPDGPAAAAMLAAGIGVFLLGLLTTLAAASPSLNDWLRSWEWGRGVGPLAGKTTVAVIGWLLAWVVLHLVWRRSNPNLRTVFTIAVIFGLLGAIGTFPTFFEAFASE
jgi:fluoride ion exporter CrcB/FEX